MCAAACRIAADDHPAGPGQPPGAAQQLDALLSSHRPGAGVVVVRDHVVAPAERGADIERPVDRLGAPGTARAAASASPGRRSVLTDARPIGAFAAHEFALDEGDPQAAVGEVAGAVLAGGAATDHDDVEVAHFWISSASADRAAEVAEGRELDLRRAVGEEQVGHHRLLDPLGVGRPGGCRARRRSPPSPRREGCSRRHAAPIAWTARRSARGHAVAVLQRPISHTPTLRRSLPRFSMTVKSLVLWPFFDELARAQFHGSPARVGLHAAAAPARTAAPARLHDHVADLAGRPATVPRLAVEDDPAAHASAPEDAEQGVASRAAPSSNSASTATSTSLPRQTLVPSWSVRARAGRRGRPSRAGCAARATVPASESIAPGEPTPTP